MRSRRSMATYGAVSACLVLAVAACGNSDGGGNSSGEFEPQQPVSMMVPFSAGGGVDLAGRVVAQILQEENIVDGQIDVENVDGGSGLVGMTRVIADSGADNQLMMTGAHIVATPLLTPDSGVAYTDFTPLATVYTEYVYFFVRPDSDIQSISDLADKLKADPDSVAIGGAVAGGASNLSVYKFADSIGVDAKELTYVPYDGDEALTALLGDKVDVGSGGPEGMDLVEAGKLKAIAVSAPEPIEGPDGQVDNWAAAGSDADFLNFRMVSGPPDMSQEAIDYWQTALTKMSETDQWKQAMEDNGWFELFKTSGLEEFLSEQNSDYKELLSLVGISSG